MPKKKETNNFEIPASDAEFRKFIKAATATQLSKFSKEQLQQLYDKALVAYPEGGKQISRAERQNLHLIQEGLFGRLDPKLQTSLENIGETLVKNPQKRKKAINYNLPSSGAVIVKNWNGKKLEVKVLESGFEYDGVTYKSLSQLAKHIAGYTVSGPIFFGLRKPKAAIAS